MRRLSVLAWVVLVASLGTMDATADSESGSGWVVQQENAITVGVKARQERQAENPRSEVRNASSTATRVCKQGAMEIPCSGPYGYWDSSKQCYVSANEELVLNTSDAARRPEGARFLMSCTSPTGQEMFTFWASSPDAAAPPPPPDPQVLARQAVASMQLAPVELGMHPKPASQQSDALGYVGWNQWMWVSNERDNTMGPISRTASLNGYSVTATAEVDRVVWDMGDGGSVSCGAGTPWRSSVADNQPSPDCGHVYEKDGEFTVTATSYWTVTWSGIGETGSFGMELSNSENHTVAEVQVVNVTGG